MELEGWTHVTKYTTVHFLSMTTSVTADRQCGRPTRHAVILTLLKQTNRILTYAKLETHYYVGETGYSDHVYSTDGVEQHNQAS